MEGCFMRRTESASAIAIAGGIVFLAMPGMALAGSLYVAANGSDSSPGTLSSPFKTISHAASVASPGTAIIVRGGTYKGPVQVSHSGTAAAYIKINPYPGEAAIIDGTGMPSRTDIVTIVGNYVVFSGFEIRNNASGDGLVAWCGHHDSFINNVVHNTYSTGVYVGCDSLGNSHDNIVQGNTVYNASMKNSAHNSSWGQGISLYLSNNSIVSKNLVYQNYGEGIGPQQSQGSIVSGNTLYDNFSMQIYLDNAPYTTVNGNFIYNTGNPNFLNKGSQAVAIGTAREAVAHPMPLAGETITNNISNGGEYGFYYGNYENGGGLQNSIVANNTFANAQKTAVHIDPDKHFGNIYMNNIHYVAASGSLSAGSTAGWTFNYNNWYGGAVSSGFRGVKDVLTNPALVRPGAPVPDGYKITATSPDAKSGLTLSVDNLDFWGITRKTPYSIGAQQNNGS